MSGKEDFIPK